VFTIPELQAARRPTSVKPLNCPHCGQKLNPHAVLVIATHNCPACGRRVVADPEGDAPPAFTLEELDAAHAAAARAQSRVLWCVLVAFLAWLVVALVVILFRDTIRAAVGSADAADALFTAVMFVPAVCGVGVAVWTERRGKRTSPKCPYCAGSLYHFTRLARLTGNCPACGRHVAQLPPDEPAGVLPTANEFRAADRRANRSVGAALFVCAVMVAAPGGLYFIQPDRTAAALEPRHGELTAAVIAAALMAGWGVCVLVVAILGMCFFSRRQRKRRAAYPVLDCPRCRADLTPVHHVIASRRCPSCRSRVLADPEPVGAAVGD
jgi:hypothetical protein